MKGILSEGHIKKIEEEAQNPVYKMQGALTFSFASKNPLSIHRVTPKGLIFIVGTEDTGFTHINQRHSIHSSKTFWANFYDDKGEEIVKNDILGRAKLSLDNPSNFHPHSIPIVDYVLIADQVFNSDNLKNEKNKHKDLFDVYEGMAVGLNKEEMRYRLILYKDSTIVHTLIPLSKKFNRQEKIVAHFARRHPTMTHDTKDNRFQIDIEYTDEYGTVRYIFIIRNNPFNEMQENWYIQINSPYGVPLFTEYFGWRQKDMDSFTERHLRGLGKVNLTQIEKRIKQIEGLLKPREA
ncbi:MAG: hypothetical protein KA165_00505 [Saprospiraceae bacterium]|nr:hypothetical protein [Saprospiraceae bacterium]